jgi:hypothetical protein
MKKGKLKASYESMYGYHVDDYYEIHVCDFEGQTYYIEKKYKDVTDNTTTREYSNYVCTIYTNSDYLDVLATHFGESGSTATIEWVEELAEVTYEKPYYTKEEVDELVPDDSGWQNVTLDSNFARYNDTYAPLQVRRIGNIVHLRGSVKSLEAFTPTGDKTTRVGLMPSGFAPTNPEIFICQGSYSKRFMLYVDPNRGLYISRYSDDDTQNQEFLANAWINLYATWFKG